jgi:aryl-alcohol dehydrogenase-like predicted oxidoreductase
MAATTLEKPHAVPLLEALDEIAAAHKVSVTAVSLSWLRAQRTVGAPIASARTLDQLTTLFESATLELSPDEIGSLANITKP